MTSPVPRDHELLSEASGALADAVTRSGANPSADTRIRMLEGAAAHIGGYGLDRFDQAVTAHGAPAPITAGETSVLARELASALHDGPLPPSLALAALGDCDLDPVARRRQGRYFTDSRLARSLMSGVADRVATAESILDPACGSGVLLVASALQAGTNPGRRASLVGQALWGVDRDAYAIRSARAAVASLTSDMRAIVSLDRHLFVADSLAAGRAWWAERAPSGFDLVVANPPWEKLRVTRHEHALASGHQRYYGDEYQESDVDEQALRSGQDDASRYRARIAVEMSHQGSGETDLYKMFLELGGTLASASGALAFLVPAGFIRNQGAQDLREWIFEHFDADLLILDNRERYFGIDSRFKFVQLLARRRSTVHSSIRFGMATAGTSPTSWRAETSVQDLRRVQGNLAIPEVRSLADWRLFTRLAGTLPRFDDIEAGWHPRFHREVDMTNDRATFRTALDTPDDIPVIEGRMVHHHRVSAKRYVAGRGRRATWATQPPFGALLLPQWYIRRTDLRAPVRARVDGARAGFCDITGQTNERTVLAALIPSGVVCGNKVPTIDFASDSQAYAWVGIANSFVFDWLARRAVTTTLNFFILRSVAVPMWDASNSAFTSIAAAARSLADIEHEGHDRGFWDVARLRARIEVMSARLYGVSAADFDQILRDFTQVDKAQEPLPGEASSTVTRDLVVASGTGWASSPLVQSAQSRVEMAQAVGAIPFIPNEHARAYRKSNKHDGTHNRTDEKDACDRERHPARSKLLRGR